MSRTCFARACFLFVALTTLGAAAETDSNEPRKRQLETAPAPSANAAECRLPGAHLSREDLARFPIVERSRPGSWRRNLKQQAQPRTPGQDAGEALSLDGRVQPALGAGARWIPGYRPQTEQARLDYEAWQAQERLGQFRGARSPGLRLLNGLDLENDHDDVITHTVRKAEVDVAEVDVRDLPHVPEGPRQNGGSADFHRSGLTWDEYRQLKDQAQDAPETFDAQQATVLGDRAPVAMENFDGIFNTAGGVPPDPILAVSSNQLVEVVNSRYRVYDIAQSPPVPLTGEISLNSFFSGVSFCQGSFDPWVDFDEENERWVLGSETIQANGDSYHCVAASKTASAAGAWNIFSYRNDALVPGLALDYPHMAIGLDAVYITGNMFLDAGGFSEIRLWALDKSELYAATPPGTLTVAEAGLGGSFFTAQPAQLNGFRTGQWPAPGTPMHFISHSGTTNRIWRWSNPFVQAPTVYGSFSATWNGAPPNAPEMGDTGGDANDTSTGDYVGAEVRGGFLWAGRAVGCNIGGGGAEACVDWVQVDVSAAAPALVQQQSGGAYGSANDFRYYPDVAVDRNGNMAVGYTKSSTSTFTEVWATGREFGDPAGQLQSEVQLVAGTGNYTDGAGCNGSCDRWGDYSRMAVDPDGCNFWYVGEYSNGGGAAWRTRISSFKYASCSVDSALNLNKSTYTCADSVTVTITDAIALSASAVAAAVTITTGSGDSESTLAGDWNGTDCVGADCGTWTATFATSGAAGSVDDGTINVTDGGSISADYADPHGTHTAQNRVAQVDCRASLDDGGFLIAGGCENGSGAEVYRAYLDGGEYLTYTFGLFNGQAAPALADLEVTLNVTGPAASAGLVTVFNPTVHIGALEQNSLTAAVFNLFIDPAVDSPTYRLSTLDFEVSVTSAADGYTTPQTITQQQLVQGDDNIVPLSECWNFESGTQGWQSENYVFSYPVGAFTVNTVPAPWTRGGGCGSETRADYPEMTCDVSGSNAFKTNGTAGSCNNFAQTNSQLTDDVNYSPLFSPVNTGNAANGQPWQYQWLFAEWFYRAAMETSPGSGTFTSAYGHFWSDDYPGVSNPAENETDTAYDLALAYFVYANQDWDSATPWDENAPPANYDGVAFPSTASGDATAGLQWRWALEVYDTDFGASPTTTAATPGLIVDDMNLVYDQYHAVEQTGSCAAGAATGTVSFDQLTQQECPGGSLAISVLDGDAASATVTVTSVGTGDSETFTISGPGPYFQTTLAYDTASGSGADDGTLFITPQDTVQAHYDDLSTAGSSSADIAIGCTPGNVAVDGVVGLTDDGDGDAFADTSESVSVSVRIRNDGAIDLTNVVATIATDDPDISCITKDTAGFGSISAGGGTAVNDLVLDAFEFKVANTTECVDPASPPTVSFDVFILADEIDGAVAPQKLSFTLDLNDLPGTSTVVETFAVMPAGWVHKVGPGDDEGVVLGAAGLECGPYVDDFFWRATGGNPAGGYFAWENPADNFPNGVYRDLNDAVLESPVFKIGMASTNLSFDHEYKFADASGLRADALRVDYSVNGGAWQKMTSLPYDGPLIHNTYCNPLCNGGDFAEANPCFSENAGDGENVFNQLNNAIVNWTNVNGGIVGLTPGDQVKFRWRFGSMNSASGFPGTLITTGGYGLDNVAVTNVVAQECDTAINPPGGCGVAFDSAANLTELCGDGDLVVEPTEEWSVDVTLINAGTENAVGTVADLAINASSAVAATTSGNPGNYGTLVAGGGTASATYGFSVDAGAVCINDITFDIVNVADNIVSHPDSPAAFGVQVGQSLGNETATQDTDPIVAAGNTASSTLSPALTFATPVDSATLSYSVGYSNPSPIETATQDSSPLQSPANGTAVSTLSPALTITIANATAASVDWSGLSYGGGAGTATNCASVTLRTPNGTDVALKAFQVAAANPYNVLATYTGVNGGPGQYSVVVGERSGGGCNGLATLTAASLEVAAVAATGNWTANAQVSLFDGTTATVLKPFGVADANPYDVTSLYDGAGPGVYEIRVQENGAGGSAQLGAAALTVDTVDCDLGCACGAPVNPVNLLADKATGDVQLTFDDSGTPGATFNIYRQPQPDTGLWSAPLATGVTDEDLGTPGIQWTDVGGVAGPSHYYKVTQVTCGGESPL